MDEDYIEESVLKVLSNHNELSISERKAKSITRDITKSIKKEIIRFHQFQNRELMKELLIKQTRIGKLEQRIDNHK